MGKGNEMKITTEVFGEPNSYNVFATSKDGTKQRVLSIDFENGIATVDVSETLKTDIDLSDIVELSFEK
jgi:hypothetical protein